MQLADEFEQVAVYKPAPVVPSDANVTDVVTSQLMPMLEVMQPELRCMQPVASLELQELPPWIIPSEGTFTTWLVSGPQVPPDCSEKLTK